jgi:arylsulfatase A
MIWIRPIVTAAVGMTPTLWCHAGIAANDDQRPNIVIVFADDLGYGDVHCYDPEHCRVPTPNIDRLAEQGLMFTDAHASAAICSPSRYSLLTGRYPWRTKLQEHVVRVHGMPLIERERMTLVSMLKEHGYRTACIGKWHLGWNWPHRMRDGTIEYAPDGEFLQERGGGREIPIEKPILDGPTTRGFDEYFGVDVPNHPPYTFIEGDRMTVDPTERKTAQSRVEWGPEGPMAPGWRFDRILPTLVERSQDFIARCTADKQPFFLYFSLTTPHEPLAPSEAFKDKSGICDVADLIMETDAALGSMMQALKEHGVAENTLLVFASDNGHCRYTGVGPFQDRGHRIAGPYRGCKLDVAEGGHRVPMVVRWPGVVEPNCRTDVLVCLSDWLATCADLLDVTLPPNAGEDSVSMLPVLRGEDKPMREALVSQGGSARELTIHRGQWKLVFRPSDGDGDSTTMQLCNLAEDPREKQNLAAEHPDLVRELSALLQSCIENGRSTAGPAQQNDVLVEFKFPPNAIDTKARE